MLQLYQQAMISQYEAALCMLGQCAERCPDVMWQAPVVNHPFSQSVFHTLFFTDLYLGTDIPAQKEQEFHRQHAEAFADYEELEYREPTRTYEKCFVADYLKFCRHKARTVVGAETPESLARPTGFPWIETTRMELHPYNVRHIQHHAGQLVVKLREQAELGKVWVKTGWQET